jgi:hypothetical protein
LGSILPPNSVRRDFLVAFWPVPLRHPFLAAVRGCLSSAGRFGSQSKRASTADRRFDDQSAKWRPPDRAITGIVAKTGLASSALRTFIAARRRGCQIQPIANARHRCRIDDAPCFISAFSTAPMRPAL